MYGLTGSLTLTGDYQDVSYGRTVAAYLDNLSPPSPPESPYSPMYHLLYSRHSRNQIQAVSHSLTLLWGGSNVQNKTWPPAGEYCHPPFSGLTLVEVSEVD